MRGKFKEDYSNLDRETLASLMDLPDNLRSSALCIIRLGRATAEDVAERLGMTRAAECRKLNQLVLMGYLESEREGHKVYFKLGEKLK